MLSVDVCLFFRFRWHSAARFASRLVVGLTHGIVLSALQTNVQTNVFFYNISIQQADVLSPCSGEQSPQVSNSGVDRQSRETRIAAGRANLACNVRRNHHNWLAAGGDGGEVNDEGFARVDLSFPLHTR